MQARCRLVRLAQAHRRLLHLCRASAFLGTLRGSSSTTSPTPRVRVPWHVAWLIVDYLAALRGSLHGSSRRSSSTTPPCKGSSSTTSPMPRVRVPRHIARLIVNYFDYVARPVASARRAARRVPHCPVASARRASRRTAHYRLLHLAQARRRLLRLRRASGCLGTLRGSSSGSSSTTSP
jgi:hypothetical protein